ncbi:MAG: hypothetical protein Q8R43_00195, partial [Alphaproteobacteria bacterium]|nr:hypothetical protein [Alphaproteobacteria bacterium]
QSTRSSQAVRSKPAASTPHPHNSRATLSQGLRALGLPKHPSSKTALRTTIERWRQETNRAAANI